MFEAGLIISNYSWTKSSPKEGDIAVMNSLSAYYMLDITLK